MYVILPWFSDVLGHKISSHRKSKTNNPGVPIPEVKSLLGANTNQTHST